MSDGGRWLRVALAVSLLINVAGLAYAAYRVKRSSWGRPGVHGACRASLFKAMEKEPLKDAIVFVGDSHTEFGQWSELLGVPVVNRGVAGDTTAQLLERLDGVTRLRPKMVFLMVGINDSILEGGVESTVASYREILRRLRTECPEAVIYAQSVLPVGPPFEGVNAWVRRVNREIAGMADGKAVIYVDMFDDFLANGVLNPAYEMGDGVHLNGEGYQMWKGRIKGLVPAR